MRGKNKLLFRIYIGVRNSMCLSFFALPPPAWHLNRKVDKKPVTAEGHNHRLRMVKQT